MGYSPWGHKESDTTEHEDGQAKSNAFLPPPGWVNPHQSDLLASWSESQPQG